MKQFLPHLAISAIVTFIIMLSSLFLFMIIGVLIAPWHLEMTLWLQPVIKVQTQSSGQVSVFYDETVLLPLLIIMTLTLAGCSLWLERQREKKQKRYPPSRSGERSLIIRAHTHYLDEGSKTIPNSQRIQHRDKSPTSIER